MAYQNINVNTEESWITGTELEQSSNTEHNKSKSNNWGSRSDYEHQISVTEEKLMEEWELLAHIKFFCNACTLNREVDAATYRFRNYHSIAHNVHRKTVYLPAIDGGMSNFPDSDEYLYAVIPGWPGAIEEERKTNSCRYFILL